MAEVRVELPDEHVAVLDGFCSATNTSRTEVIKQLLAEWSARKIHEASVIMRVAGRNPTRSESDRMPTGTPPA